MIGCNCKQRLQEDINCEQSRMFMLKGSRAIFELIAGRVCAYKKQPTVDCHPQLLCSLAINDKLESMKVTPVLAEVFIMLKQCRPSST